MEWLTMRIRNGGEILGTVRYDLTRPTEVGDRVMFPTEARFESPPLELSIRVRRGSPVVTRLQFVADEAHPEVRPTDLDSARRNLSALVEIAVSQFPFQELTAGGTALSYTGTDSAAASALHAAVAKATRSRPRTITPEFLESVAEVYRDNIHGAPNKALERHYGVAPRTAASYVERARRAGLLPPTEKGRKRA